MNRANPANVIAVVMLAALAAVLCDDYLQADPPGLGPERDQAERDLRDSYEQERADAQQDGDEIARQGALIQRRTSELLVSLREYRRMVEEELAQVPPPELPATAYTWHPSIHADYPGAYASAEIIVDGDIGEQGELATPATIDAAWAQGLDGRLIPKLDRAADTDALVLLDVEPFPITPEEVAAYVEATAHLIAKIRAEYPTLKLSLYSHEWCDDRLHVGEARAAAGEEWWLQDDIQSELAQRRETIEQTAALLAAADLDIDAVTPVCYQSRIWESRWPDDPDKWFYATDWLPPVIRHAQQSGHEVIPIVWLWAKDRLGNIIVADPDELRSICQTLYDLGIREVHVWMHWLGDLDEPGVRANLAIVRSYFAR